MAFSTQLSARTLGKGMLAATVLALLVSTAQAHEHHEDKIPEGEAISPDPLDTTLWIHILLQIFAWGILFPVGMVLGIVRSRWHVPVQIVATALAILGYLLGHAHKGRQFGKNVHAQYAPWLMMMVFAQAAMGIYLRLHLERGFNGKIRKWIVSAHGILGKIIPLAAWVQMLFGGITALGFCQGDHTGQCAAHFIMGSAFIAYGIIYTILLLVGQIWLRRTGRSQEFYDSVVIAAWGCVNTFTEHRWGTAWVRNDLQHTAMGVIWWCAGLLGVWLSRDRRGRPKRNLIPAIVIAITGWAMSGHPQELHLSTMVHSVFGYTLMAAGITRIIEISFVLKDNNSISEDGEDTNSFQFLPPFLLYASGFLFMGATEEQMLLLSNAGVTHVAYILILYSIAFLLFLFVNMLLRLYTYYVDSPTHIKSADPESRLNGSAMPNGHARIPDASDRQIRDAEEFELEGLMSEDDDDLSKRHN
ncbi:hypothetical protein D6D17_09200 [Aureobasidium pullulans]|nr:hypothetical protein D6D23_07274 [Aureobasidium pullulans]THW85363.1 hypothetical protein D6D17_09200 [Aureobasidium pullulans]